MMLLLVVYINLRVFIKAGLMEKLLHLPSLLKNSNKTRQKVILSTGVKGIFFLEFSYLFLGLKAANHLAFLSAHCFFFELLSSEILE